MHPTGQRHALWALLIASGCGGSICEADALFDALSEAQPGDEITVGDCTVQASVTVPAGVTLKGSGRAESKLVANEGEVAVTLTPGEPAVHLADLTIRSGGKAAVLAKGEIVGPDFHPTDRAVDIENVTVEASLGIGIGAEALSRLTLTNVDLTGPVTEANADSLVGTVTPTQSASHGLILVNVASAQLTDVNLSGFATFGALLVRSDTEWTRGGATANRSTGLMVMAGKVALHQVQLCNTIEGLTAAPSYGAVFTSSAAVNSTSLEVCNNAEVGLLHDGVVASHETLSGTNNGDAGLWVQRAPSFSLSGSLQGNRFANLVAIDSQNIAVQNATINGSILAPTVAQEVGLVHSGDGVQLVRSATGARLEDVTLSGNERIGVVIELDGAPLTNAVLRNVSVSAGDATQRGVQVQNGQAPVDWDASVTRNALAETADRTLTNPLQTVEVVAPCFHPTGAIASGLAYYGL